MKFNWITVEHDKTGGVPCIRGFRIPVTTVVGMVANGMGNRQILETYPDIEPEVIREALLYAAEAVKERQIPMVNA